MRLLRGFVIEPLAFVIFEVSMLMMFLSGLLAGAEWYNRQMDRVFGDPGPDDDDLFKAANDISSRLFGEQDCLNWPPGECRDPEYLKTIGHPLIPPEKFVARKELIPKDEVARLYGLDRDDLDP